RRRCPRSVARNRRAPGCRGSPLPRCCRRLAVATPAGSRPYSYVFDLLWWPARNRAASRLTARRPRVVLVHDPGRPVRGSFGPERASRPRYPQRRGRRYVGLDTPRTGHAVELLGLLDDLDQPPPLGARRRPGLHDLHAVADAGDALLVVSLQLAGAP